MTAASPLKTTHALIIKNEYIRLAYYWAHITFFKRLSVHFCTSWVHFLESTSTCFWRAGFNGFQGWPDLSHLFLWNSHSAFPTLSEINSALPNKPRSRERQVINGIRNWRSESAMPQANTFWQIRMLLEIVDQNPYCTSQYFAKFLKYSMNTVLRRLKEQVAH